VKRFVAILLGALTPVTGGGRGRSIAVAPGSSFQDCVAQALLPVRHGFGHFHHRRPIWVVQDAADQKTTPSSIMRDLRAEIAKFYGAGTLSGADAVQARKAFLELRDALTRGEVRAAENQNGRWQVNPWVKQGILLGFRLGELTEVNAGALSFVDKDT